eukprot:Trichotokara_eunicae@DN2262_c0_g1_i1.p1
MNDESNCWKGTRRTQSAAAPVQVGEDEVERVLQENYMLLRGIESALQENCDEDVHEMLFSGPSRLSFEKLQRNFAFLSLLWDQPMADGVETGWEETENVWRNWSWVELNTFIELLTNVWSFTDGEPPNEIEIDVFLEKIPRKSEKEIYDLLQKIFDP